MLKSALIIDLTIIGIIWKMRFWVNSFYPGSRRYPIPVKSPTTIQIPPIKHSPKTTPKTNGRSLRYCATPPNFQNRVFEEPTDEKRSPKTVSRITRHHEGTDRMQFPPEIVVAHPEHSEHRGTTEDK